MTISPLPQANSENWFSRWFARFWYNDNGTPRVKVLRSIRFSEDALYSEANCLHQAGYHEAAIVTASVAIRRTLTRILRSCPDAWRSDLPKKTSSWRQYAIFELAYFFWGRGVIDRQLRRNLCQFQRKVSRVASGVQVSSAKAKKMMAEFNSLRPQLDEALGRARQTYPPLEVVRELEPADFVPSERAQQLSRDLSDAVRYWYRLEFSKPCPSNTCPLEPLRELRSRVLISRKGFTYATKLFKNPDKVGPVQAKKLQKLLEHARQQAGALRLGLLQAETMIISPIHRVNISTNEVGASLRDARQVEDWITSPNGRGVQHAN